jgi:hypothetical protein
MKKKKTVLILFGLICAFCFATAQSAFSTVTIEVLSPRGEIDPPETVSISPRLNSLAGKTIGLYDIGKEGFSAYLDVTEQLFKQKYPNTIIKRYSGAFDIGTKLADKVAKEVDAVIYGSGD